MKSIKHILITNEGKSFPKLKKWCQEKNIILTCQSFIHTTPIIGLTIPDSDWIFFSSPKGARIYLEKYPVKANKVAVLGEGTLKALAPFNISADFVGDSKLAPEEIGNAFRRKVERSETVLFPISDRSKRSICKALPEENKIELITYNTVYTPITSVLEDGLILFTSPSNFESYLSRNTMPEGLEIVAIGKTTAHAIKQRISHKEIGVLATPNEDTFIAYLETMLKP